MSSMLSAWIFSLVIIGGFYLAASLYEQRLAMELKLQQWDSSQLNVCTMGYSRRTMTTRRLDVLLLWLMFSLCVSRIYTYTINFICYICGGFCDIFVFGWILLRFPWIVEYSKKRKGNMREIKEMNCIYYMREEKKKLYEIIYVYIYI